jgi:UrcA family protein
MNPQTRLGRPGLSAVLAGACVALLAVVPLAALADPPTALATHILESRVSVADLDLSTPEGARASHKRLRVKAESLCRQLWDSTSASFRWTYAACVQATLAEAIQQLNAPALVALDHRRSKPQLPNGLKPLQLA